MRYLVCSNGDRSEFQFIPELLEKNIGVELQGYGLRGVRSPEQWDQVFQQHKAFRARFDGYLAVHGPFIGVSYCHDDHLFRAAVRKRMDRTYHMAKELGANILILHSGLHSDVRKFEIYPEWIQITASYWKNEIQRYANEGITVVLENIVDDTPEFLVRVHDEVDHPNLKLCLDTGHVNVWAKSRIDEWIEAFGDRIGHVHVHNNNGLSDQHKGIHEGTLDLEAVLQEIVKVAPETNLSMEILGDAGYLMGVIESMVNLNV